MARIRTIKPEFWSDEKLAPLPPIDRLVFLGLVGMADYFGRVLDNIKIIDAFVFPNTSESCRDSLATLSRIVRIRRGKSENGQSIIEIVNWAKHQKVDKPNSAAALPNIVKNTDENTIRETVANVSREPRESAATLTNDQRPTINDLGPTIKGGSETPSAIADPPVMEKELASEVLQGWNSAMNQSCRMTEKRVKVAKVRLADTWWRENWRDAIARATQSSFCRGENDRGWVADFEWFLKPDTATKLLEGKYDNKTRPTSGSNGRQAGLATVGPGQRYQGKS